MEKATMEKITIAIIVAILIITLTGCEEVNKAWEEGARRAKGEAEKEELIININLETIAQGNSVLYLKEPITDIIYIWKTGGYKGGLSLMYDKEGNPMTYEKFLELSKALE